MDFALRSKEFTIIFASPQAAEPNGHNLDTTLAQADDDVAAEALDLSLKTYQASRPFFGRLTAWGWACVGSVVSFLCLFRLSLVTFSVFGVSFGCSGNFR